MNKLTRILLILLIPCTLLVSPASAQPKSIYTVYLPMVYSSSPPTNTETRYVITTAGEINNLHISWLNSPNYRESGYFYVNFYTPFYRAYSNFREGDFLWLKAHGSGDIGCQIWDGSVLVSESNGYLSVECWGQK
jgi:hypothetical protein